MNLDKQLTDPPLLNLALLEAEYLNEVLEQNDVPQFLLAIRKVAEAHNLGVTALMKQAKIGRTSFYKSFSEEGNPAFITVQKVLKALGFQLIVRSFRSNE